VGVQRGDIVAYHKEPTKSIKVTSDPYEWGGATVHNRRFGTQTKTGSAGNIRGGRACTVAEGERRCD